MSDECVVGNNVAGVSKSVQKLAIVLEKKTREPFSPLLCHFPFLNQRYNSKVISDSASSENTKPLRCDCRWESLLASHYRDLHQTSSSASLRWICSLESWCLTSSCLETASPTSQKSSERGTYFTLKRFSHTKAYSTLSVLLWRQLNFCCFKYISHFVWNARPPPPQDTNYKTTVIYGASLSSAGILWYFGVFRSIRAIHGHENEHRTEC